MQNHALKPRFMKQRQALASKAGQKDRGLAGSWDLGQCRGASAKTHSDCLTR